MVRHGASCFVVDQRRVDHVGSVTALFPSLPPSRPVQEVRCCAVSSVARGGRARARRGTSRKSGRLPRTTRARMYVRTWVFMAVTRRFPSLPSQVDGRSELDREAKQHKRAGLHHTRRGRPGRNSRTHVRKHARTRVVWWISLPSWRAMRHARTLGQRKARAWQAGTARPAMAHAASLAHVPLLPRAMCGRRAMAHARAAAAAPATGDSRRPRRSSRTSGAVGSTPQTRDFRREKPLFHLCTCACARHAHTIGAF